MLFYRLWVSLFMQGYVKRRFLPWWMKCELTASD